MKAKQKHSKRALRRFLRVLFLLVAALAVVSVLTVFCIVGKAVFLIDEADHMLLPFLLTMLGTAGLLAKLAEWLSRKVQG